MKLKYWLFVLLVLALSAGADQEYDLVIRGGRVIDPETQLDAVRDVGISGGTIATVSVKPLSGKQFIDAGGLVVAPGFIDVHSHTPSLLGQHMNLLDGVTTQLDLEAGAFPISFYGEHYRGGAQLNYGSSVGHFAIRMKVIDNVDQPSPAFKTKGRLQEGADADIVIFDPDTVAAQAVYGDPYQKPIGIQHVVVGGRQVVENSVRIEGRYPGRKLLGPAR